MKSEKVVALLAISALALGSACSSSVKVGPESVAGLTPDGTVDMNEVQVAYIGNAGGGSGTLFYRGSSYPFRIAGLGVDGRCPRRGLQDAEPVPVCRLICAS
jgi:hypothetical protein